MDCQPNIGNLAIREHWELASQNGHAPELGFEPGFEAGQSIFGLAIR
jgi:hypothetical protein